MPIEKSESLPRRPGSRRLLPAALLLGFIPTAPAIAQSMDYGSLQQLFGEPVTTSVTGSPQRASDVPAAMEIITQDEIRRSGATDIPGILRHVAGIDVLQWSADQSDIGIRGYDQPTTPRLLVLVDGRQVYADFYGYTPWSTLPVELADIQQIEIVKGPASALFGFNAAGGVINIVTKNPLYNDDASVAAIGGTQRLAQGSGTSTISLGSLGAIRISGGARDGRDFSTPIPTATVSSPRIGEDRVALHVNGFFRLSDRVQLRVETSGVIANDNEVAITPILYAYHFNGQSVLGQIDADTDYGLVRATAYSNWLRTVIRAPAVGDGEDFRNQVTVVQLQDIFKPAPDHTLRASFEYRHNTSNISPTNEGNVFYDVYSAAGMWSWAIMPGLSLTNAVRVDHLDLGRDGTIPLGLPLTNADWNRSFTQVTFNSGVVWKVGDDDTLRLTVGESAQLPSLVQFGALDQPNLLEGNPALQPETVTNYELGWDHSVSAIAGLIRVSLFHQRSNNLLDPTGAYIPVFPIATSIPVNGGRSVANGLELAVKSDSPDGWRWGLSYRWESITDRFPGGLNLQPDFLTDFQHTTPRHQVKANLGWSDERWEADGYLTYRSSTFGLTATEALFFPLAPVNAYAALDARIGYKLTDNLTLALSGQNLLTDHQQQTVGADVERRVFGSITIGF